MAGFVKFDGVDGECLDKDHKSWTAFQSFAQALSCPGGGATGADRRRGDVIFHDINVTKNLDKTSPKLQEAVAKGKVFPKVEFHFTASYTDAGRVTYLAYELKNVHVTSYQLGGSGQSEDVPCESISLNFEEIKQTYIENDAAGKKKGSVEFTWKVEEGKK